MAKTAPEVLAEEEAKENAIRSEVLALTNERYIELLNAERKLRALEAGGVDNWTWYDESLEQAGINGKGEIEEKKSET